MLWFYPHVEAVCTGALIRVLKSEEGVVYLSFHNLKNKSVMNGLKNVFICKG